MTHKLVLVKHTKEFAEWECPVCQRHIRLGLNGGGLKILKPGDQLINHGSATTWPGLNLNNASVDMDDPVEALSPVH